MNFFEFLQLTALIAGIIALLPEIYTTYKEKAVATEALSLVTTALFVVETMFRLPNVGKGLFNAIQTHNKGELNRNIMISVGIGCVGLSFYVLVVMIAKYNSEKTEEAKRNKRYAKYLSVILGLLIFSVAGFYGHGIYTSLQAR